jgi:hypothetical protein
MKGSSPMKTLAIDIETYSDVDLLKCGVFKYAESPAFDVLLFDVNGDTPQRPCVRTKQILVYPRFIDADKQILGD